MRTSNSERSVIGKKALPTSPVAGIARAAAKLARAMPIIDRRWRSAQPIRRR